MSTRVAIDADANTVVVQILGETKPGALFLAIEDTMDNPAYRRGMNVIADLRRAKFIDTSYVDLRARSTDWATLCESLGNCKFVSLHADASGFGTGRQAAAMFQHADVERRPYIDLADAAAWLDMSVTELEAVLGG